jgi:DNA replication protein DnaC
MSNEILNSLLKEYEQKKLKAELDLEKRKIELYKKIPQLQEIDDEINNLAFKTTKNLLNNNSSFSDFQKQIEELKYKKACILSDSNISPNYLKPFYSCTKCNDTGYITKNNYKTEMCSCLKQKLLDFSFNKSNMSNLEKENFDTFNANIFSDEVDISKYRFNISPRNNILNIKQKCIEFVEHFDNPEYKNLLFTGNTGLR